MRGKNDPIRGTEPCGSVLRQFDLLLLHGPGNCVTVVDEEVIGNPHQLNLSFNGVVGGGEAVDGCVVALAVGLVVVTGDQNAVAKGDLQRNFIVHI